MRRIYEYLSVRDCLAADWANETGIRAMEVCGLSLSQLPTLSQIDCHGEELYPLVITITKGGRPRRIYPSTRLVRKTLLYCVELRALHAKSDCNHSQVFLTRRGEPLRPKALSTNFSLACKRAGIRSTFHRIRHTFARRTLTMLYALKSDGMDPIVVVKVLLGHISRKSTEIYIDNVTEAAAEEIIMSYAPQLAILSAIRN
jgi:integrase